MASFGLFQTTSFLSAVLLLMTVYALTVAVTVTPEEALYDELRVTARLEKRGMVVSVTWTLMILAAACGEAMPGFIERFIVAGNETPRLAAFIVCGTYAFVFFIFCEAVATVTIFLRVRILAVKALNEEKSH
ncbi:hypothetical protein IKF40_00195 [Candidatus Saccharibacteria bacterium]|nr:hypothetical protein [Candidatus Saccharibacteria bacterium]